MPGRNKIKKNKVTRIFTEKGIQGALFDKYYNDNSYFLRNKFIFDWETDLFYIVGRDSSKGISVEWEIKRTRSDWAKELKTKHDKHKFLEETLFSEGDNLFEDEVFKGKFCPNYYNVTCPDGMISVEEVENAFPYASLYWVSEEGKVRCQKKVRVHGHKLEYKDLLIRKLYFEMLNIELTLKDFTTAFDAMGIDDCVSIGPLVHSLLRKLKQIQ